MTLSAALLILLAASLHAAWNFLGKKEHPSTAFFFLANGLGSLVLLPFVLFQWQALASIPWEIWLWVSLTGLFQTIYFVSLAGAYRSGDLSMVYPLARSSPVLVVLVVTMILGKRSEVSHVCIMGIILVVTGCFFLPVKSFRDFHFRNYRNLACLFAFVAALGTTGYSIVDDHALRILRGSARGIQALPVTVLYGFLEAVFSTLWMGCMVAFQKGERGRVVRIWGESRGRTFLIGALMYLAYTLVLLAMGFVSNVSYVVAFRQLSVPMGALLGIYILREPPHLPKLIGIATIFAGLILVGIG